MSDPSLDTSRRERLAALLRVRQSGANPFGTATREALVEARALGADAAGDVVGGLLDAYAPGCDLGVAERAADVAYELRLVRAVPALVACLERLPEHDAVAHAALRALERLREHATTPLLAALARCATRDARARLASALIRAGVRDGRVRAALLTMLGEDPIEGARLLAAHGDAGALPDLSSALDRLSILSPGSGELARCEEIVAVAQAVLALRGALTPEQRAKFERAYQRSDELWAAGGPEVDEYLERWSA